VPIHGTEDNKINTDGREGYTVEAQSDENESDPFWKQWQRLRTREHGK